MNSLESPVIWLQLAPTKILKKVERYYYLKTFLGEIGVIFGETNRQEPWLRVVSHIQHSAPVKTPETEEGFDAVDASEIIPICSLHPGSDPKTTSSEEGLLRSMCLSWSSMGMPALQQLAYNVLWWGIKNNKEMRKELQSLCPHFVLFCLSCDDGSESLD